MPLEKITERILEDARKQAKEIETEAKAKAAAIAEDGARQAEAEKEKAMRDASREAAAIEKQILAMAKLSSRNAVLAEKQAMIERVFGAALDRLFKMAEPEYFNLLSAMVRSVAENGQEVILSKEDRALFAGKIEKEAANAGRRERALKVAEETREIGRGFLLRGNGIEVNFSFPVLLESARERLEATVAGSLFAEEHAGEAKETAVDGRTAADVH